MRRFLVLFLGLLLVAGACAGDDGAATADAALAEANEANSEATTALADARAAAAQADAALEAAEAAQAAADQAQATAEGNQEAVAAAEAALEVAQAAADEARDQAAAAQREADAAREAAQAAQDEADAQAAAAAERAEAAVEPAEEPTDDEPALAVPVDPDPTLLPVDPDVRIGTLDNGLTYYLRSNDKPGSNLSLRLAVDAGSLHEAEPGSGVAHFLEHMMFNGTEKFPRNEILDVLRDIGVEFGPDINAYTGYDATVYLLDFVTTTEGAVEAGFEVLSQWAHAATLEEDDVQSEIGVVRDELRSRYETGSGIVNREFDRVYTAGTPYDGRDPIGTAESIESMTTAELRDFYETWYVPSNVAVIAVGDLPLDELEALVVEHFDAIPAGEAPPAPDQASPLQPEPVYEVATSPGQGYSYLSLDLGIPSWNPGTVGGERMRLMESLIAVMLESRLQDAYEQGYLSQIDPTHWSPFSYTDGLRYYGTNLRADDFPVALGDFWSIMLSLEAAGFTDGDLAHATEVVESDLQFALESEGTTQDAEYSGLYVSHFLGGDDIGTVADGVDRVSALLAGMQVTELTDHFRWIMGNSGPILLAVGADVAEVPAADEMAAAIEGATVGELPTQTVDVTELVAAPDPVDPVAEGPVAALEDAYEWSFANGATVVFMPSDISEAQVDLQAVSQGGWSAMEPGDRALAGRLATRAVRQSGLGGLSPAQISRFLDDANASVVPFIGETDEGFSGAAAVEGIEAMFQLLHLFVTAPQVDDQAFAESAQVGEIILSLAEADPDWQEWVAYNEARYGDQIAWFHPVTPQNALDALSAESLLDRYRSRLGDVDDLVVAVVGDIDRDTVGRMARTYIGTLPAGEADGFVNRRPSEPGGVVRRDVVLAPDTVATSTTIYHEAPMAIDPATEVVADVLGAALGARLDAEVREAIGATYSAYVSIIPSLAPEPTILSQLTATGDPERMEDIRAEVFRILVDLVDNGLGAEQFAQALAVVQADYTHIQNQDLLGVLLRRAHAADDQLPTSERLFRELSEVTAADVHALAVALYDPDQHIEIVRVLG